jgi:glycosyltransferase involved in cell wall biosynthesis
VRIAYIGIKGLPSKGGAERVVEAIVQRLARRHEITVYCSNRYTPPDAIIPGVRLIRLPCLPGKHTHMTSVDFLAAWHAVLYGKYDLIHLHNIEAGFVLPILKLRYRVIATAHGRISAGNKWSRIPAAMMRLMEIPFGVLSDAMTSTSLLHAQQFSDRFHRPVLYIPNGVETDAKVDLEAARRMLEASHFLENRYILFAAGRIIPLKGAHLLLDAFRRIKSEYRLVLVGDPTIAPKYANSLKASADSRTVFLPFIQSNAELLGLVSLCRLFVFPSTNEAMSMALLEAASVGAPILCSDIPANTAVLPEQALYFRSGDADDLADKLRWALDHPAEMTRLGQQAQEWVKAKFSWDLIAEQYDQLYHSAWRKS